MDLDDPRWGFIGVGFTLVVAISGGITAIIFNADPQKQAVGIIIFLVSIVACGLLYWRFRVVKEIIYQVSTDTMVVTVDEAVRDKVQILFNGNPVYDARLIVLLIRNTGSTIKTSDYETPFSIDFGEDAQILDLAVLDTMPTSIESNISLEIIKNKAILKPLLLNSKDSIKLKARFKESEEESDN